MQKIHQRGFMWKVIPKYSSYRMVKDGGGGGYSLESPILAGVAQKGYLFWASGILWGEVYEWVEKSLLGSPGDVESSVKGNIKLLFHSWSCFEMSNNTKSYLNLSFILRICQVIFFQFHIFQVM